MLVMSRGALTAAQAESYYEEKYSQDDYYTEQQHVAGQWFGRGAESLGLCGEVATEDFCSVLRGVRPASDEVLVHKANGYDDRRAGWDATFNAPKSVSIQALAGDDRRLVEAHREAVTRALQEIEQYALSRRRGGSEWVVTSNMVAAKFDHIAARPASGVSDSFGPDPHLHTHVVIANMTRRPDGEWRGLDPIEIYRAQAFATAVYRSELARSVQRLGYEIKVSGSDGRWELDGYTREQVMAFSRRRHDIEQTLMREGLSGAEAAQNIAHRTRLSKDHRDEQELKAEWRMRAQHYGISLERKFSQPNRSDARVDSNKAEEAIHQSIADNTEREAVIDRRALEARALQHAMGKLGVDRLRRESERFQARGQLIAASASVIAPQGAFTTPEMIALETENIELMRAGQGRASVIANGEEIRDWSITRGLMPDQAKVAELTLTSRDWLTSIEGRAGAAKTTTVGAIREFAEEQGYTVNGFAPTTRAVKSLQEARIPSRTVASLLENQQSRTASKEIWIIDEASLLPTRRVNRLLQKAKDQGVERVIFVGDQRQHHAIEAGRPVFQMQLAGMSVARLDTIRRQRDPELRNAVVHAAKGEVAESLAILENRGAIREFADIEQRRKQIARDYTLARERGERVLVVSPANQERRELNQAIRAELLTHGHVAREDQEHAVFVNRNLSGSQRTIAYNYREGDVIRFTRGSRQFGIAKGEHAHVLAVDSDSNVLVVRKVDGRRVEYNPARLFGVEVFQQESRVLARGDRIQFRAPERTLAVTNGEFATITELTDRQAIMRMDDGRKVRAALDRLQHIDHGYASTSHSAQGATVDHVIVDIDTRLSSELVNRKQFYVSMSRARTALTIYTNDRAQLRFAVNRNREKSMALEHSPAPLQRGYTMVPEQHRSISRGHGIRR